MSDNVDIANDYAVAKSLNERVWKILWYVADLYPFYEKDLDKINRNYIFLVQELSEIYTNNKELQDVQPKPAWQRYKQIDGHEKSIADLQDDRTGDTGQTHTAEVKRLCIVKGKEEPDLNARQKKLIAESDEIIAVLTKEAEEERKHLQALQQKKLAEKAHQEEKPSANGALPAPTHQKVTPHPLKPIHYTNSKGTLALSPTVSVAIVARGKIKRPDGEKYLQCVVMEKLFKSVNNIKRGVFFRNILSVNDPLINKKMEKKISNAVAEINKKVTDVGGPEKLIKIQNKKVFVNSSYLE